MNDPKCKYGHIFPAYGQNTAIYEADIRMCLHMFYAL